MAINDYDDLILGAANQYKVNPQLLKAVMQVESGGNQNDPKTGKILTSSAGAQGLMQFIPKTAAQYGVNVNDPRSSIYGAARYLNDLLNQYNNNPDTALDHYSGNTPGYGQKILSAYRSVAPPVGRPAAAQTAAAPAPAGDALTPAERSFLTGGTPTPAPTASAPSAPSVVAQAPTPQPKPDPLTPAERQVLQPPQKTPPANAPQGDRLTAIGAGLHQGVANVVNSPSAWFGWNPLMDTKLSPEEQASLEAYPTTGAISRIGGEALTTAPLIMGATAMLPEAAGLSLPMLAARGLLVGGATGAAQGALTSGEKFQPGGSQDNVLTRMGKGAMYGAPFGALGGAADWALGAGETIAPEVQKAGQEMQTAGVDVLGDNLPRTGSRELGAAATQAQVKQTAKAWGNIFGENTPDYSAATLNRVIPKLGNDVGNAVRAGHIDADVPLAGGKSFIDTLAEIEADTPRADVRKLINNIVSEVDSSNQIPGAKIADILRTDNPLDKASRNARIPDLSDAANKIEAAVKEAFTNSSPSGIGKAYALAREKYKLALVGERASDLTTGEIDPKELIRIIPKMYPDAKYIGTGTSMTDKAINFARNANQLFGGSAPARSAAQDWTAPALLTSAFEPAVHYLPGMADNPLLAAGLAATPLAARAARRFVQGTAPFARNLLRRGASSMQPYAPALSGAAVTSATQ